MRVAKGFAAFAAMAWLGAGRAAAGGGDGVIGIYADLTATQTSAIFALGVPRTIFVVARTAGQTDLGIAAAEFRIDGFPNDWFVFVTPNPAANIVIGDPFRSSDGVHRANLVFPSCTSGTQNRILLYTAVVIANSVVSSRDLTVAAGDPPTNPEFTTPVLLRCNIPDYTPVAALGGTFHLDVRAPQDLDYSLLPGYDGVRGVQPQAGLPGDVFHFRVLYSSSDLLAPAAGSPRLELDVNGDGDANDTGEGAFTMSPADQDSTLANGKEYRYDVGLGAPPGGRYRYRFTAIDGRGASVPGVATAWRDSLLVSADLADLVVDAEGIRVTPGTPHVDQSCGIVTRIENRSERRVDGITVRIDDVFGATILQRTLTSMGPRSATEVAGTWQFGDAGFQPVVVRIDPANEILETDESNNVASHAVYVGAGATGSLTLGGLPPLVTVPPVAPFTLTGNVLYATGALGHPPVRGARVVCTPSWEQSQSTRTDPAGDFRISFIAPAVPGSYRISFAASDGARTDSVIVNAQITPFAGGLPPHGPNLVMQLSAVQAAVCPTASGGITWSVVNRGDRTSDPTTVGLIVDGTTTSTAPVAALAPGATATLVPTSLPLIETGLHAFTAHVDPASTVHELREDDNYATASVRVSPACLDLALDQVRFTSTPFCIDSSLAFAAQVANRGCTPSLPARVACRVGGAELASAPLAALTPGESTELLFSHVFTDVACRELDLVLDPEGAAGADCDLGSNALSASVCIVDCNPPPPPLPADYDVQACDLSVSNSRPGLGENVHFQASIANVGQGDGTGPVRVRFNLDNHLLSEIYPVGPIHAGQRLLVTAPVTWPVDFAPHVLNVNVELSGQSAAASRPLPWALRASSIGRCPPASPSMFSTCSPCQGVPLDIRAVAVNDGLFDADSVRVEFRDELAGNAVIGSAVALDVRAGSDCVTLPDPVSITHPFSTTGLHRVVASVDPQNRWPEDDETNNAYSQEVSVGCAIAPDLVASLRIPGSAPQPGDSVRAVEVTVTNRGLSVASGVQARLRLDGVTLCNLEMGNLSPGASSTTVCTTPWVVGPSPCAQRLEACADPDNRIAESDETNNCTTSGITGGPDTDLAVFPYDIRVTPPNPGVGQLALIQVAIYSLRGVESTCLLSAAWSLTGSAPWQPIGLLPLHLPADHYLFPDAATFAWTVPAPRLTLRFEILDVCPSDISLDNNVAYGSLPWFIPPGAPVTVSDLEAKSTDEGVVVHWRAEGDVEAFALARRTHGETTWDRLPETLPLARGSSRAQYEIVDRTAEPGARLDYRLLGLEGGAEQVLGSLSLLHDAAGAWALQLHPVRPNPFRPGNVFEFSLPARRGVELCVFDAVGRRVATLSSGSQAAGRHAVTWDGRDERGRRVPAGVYFCRLAAESFQQTRRLVLVH